VPFAQFSEALHPDWQWHSVQKETRASDEESKANWMKAGKLHDHGPQLLSFDDTAALIEQLDLVLTVDTSVAHLAAAMGKPTWILIGWRHDFRWMKDRTDSPWYPSVKLWRQAPGEPWGAVLERVRVALGAQTA
jgi:ADP-heptose:LPS heptosyltransferase